MTTISFNEHAIHQAATPHGGTTVLHARIVGNAGGGPDKTILRSHRYLDSDAVRMYALYIHPGADHEGIGVIRGHAQQWASPLIELPERHALDPALVGSAWRVCRALNVDIWHAHDYKSTLLGLIVNRLRPMRLVVTAHGWVQFTTMTQLYYRLERSALPCYDHVIAVSEDLAETCIESGVDRRQVTYVPNSIEPTEFRRTQAPSQARAAMGCPSNAVVIGVVGRLSDEKGVDRAIELVNRLAPTIPHLELHVIGDGPARARLQMLAHASGATVRMLGWQTDARPFYEAMDLLLLPSYREGLPNVVLEAMAMRVPVAATRVGGVNDLLDDGRCGLLLDRADDLDWPSQVASLLRDPSRRERFVNAARQRIEQRFSFAARMQRIGAIYQQVLAGETGSGHRAVA